MTHVVDESSNIKCQPSKSRHFIACNKVKVNNVLGSDNHNDGCHSRSLKKANYCRI